MNGQESECKVGESKEEHKVLKQREMGVLQSIGIKGSVMGYSWLLLWVFRQASIANFNFLSWLCVIILNSSFIL